MENLTNCDEVNEFRKWGSVGEAYNFFFLEGEQGAFLKHQAIPKPQVSVDFCVSEAEPRAQKPCGKPGTLGLRVTGLREIPILG